MINKRSPVSCVPCKALSDDGLGASSFLPMPQARAQGGSLTSECLQPRLQQQRLSLGVKVTRAPAGAGQP
jgi:hypothetical protein